MISALFAGHALSNNGGGGGRRNGDGLGEIGPIDYM